jgi:hypothetical protein
VFQRRGVVAGTVADTHWVGMSARNVSCLRVAKRMWAAVFLAAMFALPFATMITKVYTPHMQFRPTPSYSVVNCGVS